jgi:hypothetical protein
VIVALLNIGKKLATGAMGQGRKLARGTAQEARTQGRNIGMTPKAFPMLLGGVFAAGLLKDVPGQAIDIGNEAAFGDEDADKAFLGSRGLSAGTVFDSTIGEGAMVGGTVAGGAIGAAGGGMLGMGVSKVLTDSLKNTNIHNAVSGTVMPPLINAGQSTGKFPANVPLVGGKNIPKSLIKPGMHSPKVRGFGAVGAIAGAAIGGSAMARSYVNRNRDFFESNPYSRGSAMQAASTNAYGDVVLGMHNSRRG